MSPALRRLEQVLQIGRVSIGFLRRMLQQRYAGLGSLEGCDLGARLV
jgi:hypothetical protein